MSTIASLWSSLVGAVPVEAVYLLVLALGISALGWLRLVYFVSLGYGFSIAAMAVVATWLFRFEIDLPAALHAGLLLAYGLRLGIFLLRREQYPSYRREIADTEQRAVGIGPWQKLAIWGSVALLYVLMYSPSLLELDRLRALGDGGPALLRWSGLLIMAAGLGAEALADQQKSRFKAAHPDRFCDVGLYRLVRCPNYLGEVVFWIGNFVAGIAAYLHGVHWLAAAVGLICIVLIMMGSTKRLERKQDERYGADPDYQRYVRSVPVLFPFVPIYSLKGVRVYLE